MIEPIPFIDLKAQQARIGGRIKARIDRVLEHGQFIMGPEVKELEAELAVFAGTKHCVTCASGTDALLLPLMAHGIGRGDAVFIPTFTFVATAEVVALLGATPVFVDIEQATFNICPRSLEGAITIALKAGLKPKAVIPVDLFGLPVDTDAIEPLVAKQGLHVISDAAQSFGGSRLGKRVGSLAEVTATSFFPAKPLGCYGDGGAVFTDNDELAAHMRSLRVHGQGSDKYDNVRIGVNARLDTIQAAVLLEKLAILADEIERRNVAADRYASLLQDLVTVPKVMDGYVSAWAQYTILSEHRDKIAAGCKAAGVPTAIYYPRPLHRQTGYVNFPTAPGGCPVSERVAEQVISLPMHPYLEAGIQERVAAAIRQSLA